MRITREQNSLFGFLVHHSHHHPRRPIPNEQVRLITSLNHATIERRSPFTSLPSAKMPIFPPAASSSSSPAPSCRTLDSTVRFNGTRGVIQTSTPDSWSDVRKEVARRSRWEISYHFQIHRRPPRKRRSIVKQHERYARCTRYRRLRARPWGMSCVDEVMIVGGKENRVRTCCTKRKEKKKKKESLTSLMLAKSSSHTTERSALKERAAAQVYIALGSAGLRSIEQRKGGMDESDRRSTC